MAQDLDYFLHKIIRYGSGLRILFHFFFSMAQDLIFFHKNFFSMAPQATLASMVGYLEPTLYANLGLLLAPTLVLKKKARIAKVGQPTLSQHWIKGNGELI